jgi:hypothetical protein
MDRKVQAINKSKTIFEQWVFIFNHVTVAPAVIFG